MVFETDATLRIDEMTFWGGAGDEGFFINSDGFEGWEDTPDVRFEEVQRPDSDGDFDSEPRYAARLLIVTGKCQTRGGDRKLGLYGQQLRSLLRGKKRAHVDYQGVKSFADGRLASAVKFRTSDPGREARFQFTLRFANPRRYGALTPLDVTGPGVVQPIYHRGNFDAAPTLIVRGSMPGYRIEGPGFTYVVDRPVTAATPHVIDNATGLLSINGVVQFGAITSGTGWLIAPGSRPVTHKLVPVSGTGTLETRIRDTYI
jgi:hypothetical protein